MGYVNRLAFGPQNTKVMARNMPSSMRSKRNNAMRPFFADEKSFGDDLHRSACSAAHLVEQSGCVTAAVGGYNGPRERADTSIANNHGLPGEQFLGN